jgi:oligosaccharyltransferase complex subunit beta
MTASLPPHQPISSAKRTLVLLDEPSLKNATSKYFDSLTSSGHSLKFKKFSESSTVNVKSNGEFEYDNVIILMAGSQNPTDRSIVNLLEFVDAGGNVLLATTGQGKWAKEFALENGVKLGDTAILDRFPPSSGTLLSVSWPQGKDILLGAPPGKDAYIHYFGTSAEATTEATAMGALCALSATPTSYQPRSAISGTRIGLISSVEMQNNARVTVSGSVSLFDDSNAVSNGLFLERLTKWTFGEASVLRVRSWRHRKVDGKEAERQVKHARHLESNLPRSHFPDPEWGPNAKIYRIRDEVEYRMELEVLGFDGKWHPYVADDIQIEFAMLDPYQRRTFSGDGRGTYAIKFMLPDQYGTFAFRVVYNRPGVSRLRVLDSVNVRPFRHDEYERFIVSAFPYYSAVGVVMVGFLLFSVSFAMVRKPHIKTE